MKQMGPQIADPVGLLCKPNGRYEILPGQGVKRVMALRLAGYKEAVADIMVPKKAATEVKAENINNSSPEVEHASTFREWTKKVFGKTGLIRNGLIQYDMQGNAYQIDFAWWGNYKKYWGIFWTSKNNF